VQFVKHNSSYQLISALQYGPVVAAVDASSSTWQNYNGQSIISDSMGCGSTVNSVVLVTGFNNGGNGGTPYFSVKWADPSWGVNGVGKIGIVNGVGVCGIQSEVAIPNLLLTSDTLQVLVIFILLGITLVIMVPLSFFFWEKHKEKLAFMHPGQLLLRKAMFFEAIYIAVGLGVFIWAETSNLKCWDIE
jgi:hypothetical protein